MTDERLDTVLGYTLCYIVIFMFRVVVITVGLGHVEEKTSFGLQQVMGGFIATGSTAVNQVLQGVVRQRKFKKGAEDGKDS